MTEKVFERPAASRRYEGKGMWPLCGGYGLPRGKTWRELRKRAYKILNGIYLK